MGLQGKYINYIVVIIVRGEVLRVRTERKMPYLYVQ